MATGPRLETHPGQPVTINGHRLTLFHQVFRLDFPNRRGGLIWNRPYSVLVTRPDGSEQVLPVVDITRIAVWFIWGFALLYALLSLRRRRK